MTCWLHFPIYPVRRQVSICVYVCLGDKTLDGYQKKKYVAKLLFIFLLGHDIDFGHMEAVNLLSSNKYTEKQIVSHAGWPSFVRGCVMTEDSIFWRIMTMTLLTCNNYLLQLNTIQHNKIICSQHMVSWIAESEVLIVIGGGKMVRWVSDTFLKVQ